MLQLTIQTILLSLDDLTVWRKLNYDNIKKSVVILQLSKQNKWCFKIIFVSADETRPKQQVARSFILAWLSVHAVGGSSQGVENDVMLSA